MEQQNLNFHSQQTIDPLRSDNGELLSTSSIVSLDLNTNEQEKDFEIPFWLLMQIEEKEKVILNINFHVPSYKQHSALTNETVKEEIAKNVNQIF